MVDGFKVKHRRLARGLNQRELSERSGVTVNAISEIEQGKRTPQVRTITLLAEALDVRPEMLLNDGANMHSLIEDGTTLWHLNRPASGWSMDSAKDIDEAALSLARKFGTDRIYLWMARDAWNVVAPHLRHNKMLRAPGVKADIGPEGTQTGYCFIQFKADPESQRPAYMQAMLEGQGLVPRSGDGGTSDDLDGTEGDE